MTECSWEDVVYRNDPTVGAERPLSIGLIAPPWVAVPPPLYGGTEAVVDHLARGLVDVGHHVRLFTTGDATCPVERHWLHPAAVGTTGTLIDELGHVQAAYAELADCDIIHDHTLLGPLWAVANGITTPVVTTAHGVFTPELTLLYAGLASRVAVVAISHHQASSAQGVRIARVIHHGIDTAAYPLGRGDGGYVAFLGRMHPDKGAHRAIEVARLAGKKLLIAAKMWEEPERRYFHERVEPLLGDDAVYVGQVGGADKAELLAGAEALINPIRWPEPFGLVMIEAMASGTPVLAFAEGAAPEIVEHGRTGFLCNDEADMARHLADIGSLERVDCRQAALDRFSTGRMVDDHIALYREHIAASTIDLRHDAVTGSTAGTAPLGADSLEQTSPPSPPAPALSITDPASTHPPHT